MLQRLHVVPLNLIWEFLLQGATIVMILSHIVILLCLVQFDVYAVLLDTLLSEFST